MDTNGAKRIQNSTKTNGFLSEYFQISRSIKQGCPSVPLLYIIQAEAMAASIRSDPNIKGIHLPLHDNVFRESRLSQFVDDTQLFCKNEKYLSYMFKCLSLYEKASGAKRNKAKTTGLLIGSLKNKSPKFKDIKWTKSSAKH